jgi:hypothetical protein
VHKSTIQRNGQFGQTAKLCFELLSLKAAFLKAQQNSNSLVGKPFVELTSNSPLTCFKGRHPPVDFATLAA